MENILITGASTGIGYSLCKVFLDNGFRVIGSVRKEEDALRLSTDFKDHFHPLIFDVTNHKAVENSVKEVVSLLDGEGLSCLVNNAGIAVGGPVKYTSIEDYKRQFDVNLFGVIAVTKAYLPLLGADENHNGKPGKILNISSVSGQIAFPFLSPYCASKFALEAFGESLRRELVHYGIDVISIQPGPVKTPIWSKSKGVSPEVMASDYGTPMKRFLKETVKSEQRGLEAGELANSIFKVYRKRKPKTKYVFLNNKFKEFTIPRYLISPRMMDRFIKKTFFSKRS
jgi:NAD(P)-dependent dehydrogenase (short-subunit alcohol dehydrogenase family)